MITSTYDWKINTKEPDAGFFKLAKEHGLVKTAAKIAYERGIRTEEALEDFLKADLSHLHDPYLLHDMDKAVARIRQAIENYEQILVYGDYDADGMTSASIVKEALEMMGAEARVYLPNRFTDGYGPNESVYKYFIEQEGISPVSYTHLSNFTKPGMESRHNLMYWNNDEYYGVGAGASGYVNGVRYRNRGPIQHYLKACLLYTSNVLSFCYKLIGPFNQKSLSLPQE